MTRAHARTIFVYYVTGARHQIRTDTYGGLNPMPLPIGLLGRVWYSPTVTIRAVPANLASLAAL